MIDKTADLLPIWMMLSAALGYLAGKAYADLRHQHTHDELRDRLQKLQPDRTPIQRSLKEQRGILNDIHKRLLAVSKALEKRTS